jgi:cytochrome c oxidase subunit 1
MAVTEATAPEAEEIAPAADDAPAEVQGWPASTDHKVVGTLYVVVGILFLVATGVIALVMRAQLSGPHAGVVSARTYRELFTIHGVLGVFLFLAPLWLGLGTALVPLQIGASRLAFPRLQPLALWGLVAGGVLVVASPFVKGAKVTSGWALSSPIPEGRAFRGHGPDLLILGMGIVAVAIILAAVNLVVTIVTMRAPGLTSRRAPLFSWSVLVSSAVLILALPVLVGGLLMLFADRHYGGQIFRGFTGAGGGNPTLWPRLFWFAAYPTLWALLIPALGVVSEIVATFARRPLVSHERAIVALSAVGVLSFAGWGSEVTNIGRGRVLFALGALAVLAPLAALVLNWLVTVATALRRRRRQVEPGVRATPVLFAAGFVTVLGVGMAGAVASAVGAGGKLHRTYWQVAEQHTLFFGAASVGALAALTYWAPKLWGRHLSDKAGPLAAVLVVGGLHLTFLPMFVLGLQDMGVHVAGYRSADGFGPANVVAGVGAAVTALGVVVFALDLVASVLARRGPTAASDPWQGHTLEWATSSPPPRHNFDRLPEVGSEAPLLDLRAGAVPPDAVAVDEGQGS